MKRDASVSIIRNLSLLAIICCHILQGLNIEAAFWVNLGVQVFLFMSGFLYGQKNIENPLQWYIKQFKKIFIPYILVVSAIILIDSRIFEISYTKTTILSNLLGLQGFRDIIPTISHTWFVSYILIYYFLTPLLQSFKLEKLNNFQTVIFLIVSFLFLYIFDYFAITAVSSAWVFNYILGYLFAKKYTTKDKKQRNFVITFTILTFIVLIPRIIIQYQLFNIHIPSILINKSTYIQHYSHVLLGSWIFIILYLLLSKYKIKYNRILQFSDKYSYCIYLVHQIFILYHMSILHLTNSLILNILCILILSIFFGIILKLLSDIVIQLLSKIDKKIGLK